VKDFGGVLLHILNELEIKALPTALVPAIEVDISKLTAIGQSITVGDITPPPGVTILNAPNDIVVQVIYAEEEEEKEAATAPAPAEVEVIRKRPAAEEA